MKALQIVSESDYKRLIGGLFYVFLRALRRVVDEPKGVYFKKMTWAEILEYEARLKQRDPRSEEEST